MGLEFGIRLWVMLVLVLVLGLALRETEVRPRERAPTLGEASLVLVLESVSFEVGFPTMTGAL
jgi:hypothetical protein